MIKILTGTNEVIMTLSENQTNSGYGYIFEFEGLDEVIYFTTTEITTNERYDSFNLIVNSGDTNLTGATINIKEIGLMDYKVYEQLNPILVSDLTADNVSTLSVIEIGKVDYYKETIVVSTTKVNTINKKTLYN